MELIKSVAKRSPKLDLESYAFKQIFNHEPSAEEEGKISEESENSTIEVTPVLSNGLIPLPYRKRAMSEMVGTHPAELSLRGNPMKFNKLLSRGQSVEIGRASRRASADVYSSRPAKTSDSLESVQNQQLIPRNDEKDPNGYADDMGDALLSQTYSFEPPKTPPFWSRLHSAIMSSVYGLHPQIEPGLNSMKERCQKAWDNPIKLKLWDAYIVIVHFYNLIMIPLTIGWVCDLSTPGWIIFAFVLDFSLLLNVKIMSNRPYVDQYGILITDPKAIRTYYFKNNYGIYELLGSIPIDLLPLIFLDSTSQCAINGEINYLSHVLEYVQCSPVLLYFPAFPRLGIMACFSISFPCTIQF
jgi:hypothetical protein